MKITSKSGEELNFLESGVDGIYVLDHIAFMDCFDEGRSNDWEKSTGKRKLQEWAEKNLSKEILEQFDVDLPMVEEVFSQKMLNWWGGDYYVEPPVSKQFPIFKDSDSRMMEFEGQPAWWWTRSSYAGGAPFVWIVYADGGVSDDYADGKTGFVPVLRAKAGQDPKTKPFEITLGGFARYYDPDDCVMPATCCPLGMESDDDGEELK